MSRHKKSRIIEILTHKPASFLAFFFVGVILHQFFPVKLFSNIAVGDAIGIPLLLIGTVLLVVGEYYQRKFFEAGVDPKKYNFLIGLYRWSRHPSTLGLLAMYVGFVFIFNSLVLLGMAAIVFLLLTFVVLPYEENLVSRVGADGYKKYKAKVPMWM